MHGADAAHAPVAFVAAALEQHDLARRFFGTGKHAAHHHAGRPGGNGLGHIAAVAHATVGNQRNAASAQGGGHTVHRHDLRYAHAGHDARGANRARADADLDGVRARLHQRARCRAGGDIAAHHVHMRVVLFDPAHPVDHALTVAVRGIHHDGVHTGPHQRFYALFGALAHANGRADAQLALGVAGRVGETRLFGDVFDSDQAFELKRVVHHQQALQAVLIQQGFGLAQRGAVRHRHQPLARRHDLADGLVITGLKAQIPPRHDADHFAAVADREARHTQLVRQRHDFAHREMRRDHHRVAQHARFVALDLGDLRRLLSHRQVFMHDADAAFLGYGDRQTRLGHRVHGSRHQGQIQGDVAGKKGGKRGVLG